jgi:hypothetical protein
MSHKIRSLVLVALLLVLATGPVAGLPMEARTPSAQAPSVLSGLWDWFACLVTGLWEKEGSQMDPNGTPAPGEAGSSMDPNGTPVPNKAGSQMDPDGLNATGCPTEAGGTMDPNGQPTVCPSAVG